ncbi:activator of basal transcription 1-like [Asterias rubens]|uniref:activator of basal transcription 1-like n=1 Tax=Asterias rubens TaxID=7604 RepID=UPI001455BED2|nr:activator of basal transcription 1-like [Asterias rubens]
MATIASEAPPSQVDTPASSHESQLITAPKTKKKSQETQPGIVYLSRIPTFMKPRRIQQIFGQHGEIGRTFMQPEDKNSRQARKKKGGSKTVLFCEGWVEYKDKKIAKRVALTLNNTRVSGKKRSRYYDDLWSLKYLHRFQWAHLAGQLEYERQVQKQRVRAEVVQVKKETNLYLKNVEKSTWLDRMEKKKKKQGQEWTHRLHEYKQRTSRDRQSTLHVQRSGKVSSSLLGKIFASKE